MNVLFQKHKSYIHQLMDWMEVHVTVGNITTLPAGIINHGILSSEDYRKLLGRVQVLSFYDILLKSYFSIGPVSDVAI